MCQRLAEAVVGGAWQDNNTLCSAVCSRERQDCHVTGSMELLYCNTPTHTHTQRQSDSLSENVCEESVSPFPCVGVQHSVQVLLGYSLGGGGG